MKFAENGYYIERYIKCDNCGVLIYHAAVRDPKDAESVYCTRWCMKWKAQKAAGTDMPEVALGFDE